VTAEVAADTEVEYTARVKFLARIRDAIAGRSRAEALKDAVQIVGSRIGWHESEAVAEALRHRYDDVLAVGRWLPVHDWHTPDMLACIRAGMRTELVLLVDGNGSALVDEPVEWTYAAPDLEFRLGPPADDERGRTPLTAAQVAALPDNFYVLIKLVGHTQRLDR
jgi:hypothetical protein